MVVITFTLFFVSVKFSCSELKFTIIQPMFRYNPSFFPSIYGVKEEKKQHIKMVYVFLKTMKYSQG